MNDEPYGLSDGRRIDEPVRFFTPQVGRNFPWRRGRMEYLAHSYPAESVIRLIEPRTVQTDLADRADRRDERAPPGDRLTLVYDEGEKRNITEETGDLSVRKSSNSPKIYVLQSRAKDIRGSPYQEALMAYQRAQWMGEPEAKPYLDIRV